MPIAPKRNSLIPIAEARMKERLRDPESPWEINCFLRAEGNFDARHQALVLEGMATCVKSATYNQPDLREAVRDRVELRILRFQPKDDRILQSWKAYIRRIAHNTMCDLIGEESQEKGLKETLKGGADRAESDVPSLAWQMRLPPPIRWQGHYPTEVWELLIETAIEHGRHE